MKIEKNILIVLITMVIVALIIPTDVVSGDPSLQETDVCIAREFWYLLENGTISSGGSSIQAPTYHPLFVTEEENVVTFHNYAEIHDERVQSTQYNVIWSIVVYEEINGNLEYIDSEETGTATYSPPQEIIHPQTINIEVNFCGVGTHLYYVCTEYKWYEVNNDGSKNYIDTNEYSQAAIVFEVTELEV